MKLHLVLLLFTALYIAAGDCAKILCVMPVAGRSHTIVITAICKELAARKHDVTAITHFPIKNPPKNYKQVSIEELAGSLTNNDNLDIFEMRKLKIHLSMPYFQYIMMNCSNNFLGNEKVQRYLNTDEKYDLLVVEEFLSESVMGAFMHKTRAPTVVVRTFMANLYVNDMVGNPSPDSYIPDTFLELGTKMSFTDRLYNHVYGILHKLVYHGWVIPSHDKIMRRHLTDNPPPLSELLTNVSLIVMNHHYSLSYTRPYVPNMIEMAGMHVGEVKPLPKDLKKFMDEATDGVIYFSLGSAVKSVDMPLPKRQAIMEAFSRLKQKVLWKFEVKDMPNKPDNVMIHEWVPQTDILAHPNLKLFITHGGLGSTIETTYRGVPTIGIPIMAEQGINLMQSKVAGMTEIVELDDLTADLLYDTIIKVLNDPSYKENAIKRSSMLRDTPLSAMDNAMFWIEYVIRHKGAAHMRSAALDLSWYQLYLLDVYAVILTVLFIFLYINCKLIKFVINKCSSSKKVSSHKKNK